MKTNIDEPCAGNLQARFFRGSCSNKTQTRGVKLQLLPNSKKEKEKSAKELLENSCKNIYERDENGRTALHYAVEVKTVELLVEKGANVNAADVKGYTALHLAVTEKRLEIVRELIKSGADVNAEEYGNKCIPLHLACMVGEKEIVEELVKAGGEIEQEDECGMTAIDYAKNSKEVTEVLKKETDRIEKLFEQIEPSMRG